MFSFGIYSLASIVIAFIAGFLLGRIKPLDEEASVLEEEAPITNDNIETK